MFCEKCGASVIESVQFCPKCGSRIAAEQATEKTEEKPELEEKNQKKQKKKSKVKRVLLSIVLILLMAAITGGVLVFRWYNSDEQKILRALENGDYDDAVSLYTSDYNGSTASIESTLESRLEKIKEEYIGGEMEYAVAVMELDAIARMEVAGVEGMLGDIRDYIAALNQSRIAFDTAEDLFGEGDYAGAIQQYRQVSDEDDNYDTAKDKLVESIEKYREQILAEAEAIAAEDSYQAAMDKIEDALEIIPDDAKLQPEYDRYADAYVNSILAEADSLVGDSNYNGAISKINEALRVVGASDVLEAKLEEVQGSKPVSLSSLTAINGGWTWNEGTPTDPFGVTYSSATNFVILNKMPGVAEYTGEDVDVGRFYGIYESYAEYRLYGEYTLLTFDVVPYCDIDEDFYGTIKVYADDMLVFSSPQITRKTDIQNYQVDVSNAEYVKIVADTVDKEDNILLMNCTLRK